MFCLKPSIPDYKEFALFLGKFRGFFIFFPASFTAEKLGFTTNFQAHAEEY